MTATSFDLSAIKTDVLSSAANFRSLIGLGTLATQNGNIADYLTIASAALSYQPLDADLTSIAALTTTTYGRSLLTQADASATRTTLGLGTLATQSPTGTANSTTYLRGDFTWQTISGGGTWGSITGTLSSQTDLQSALDAKASLSGATFTGRITTPSVLLSGNFSSTAWTTSGVGLSHTARTLTDTSSTGTVATAYTNVLGGNTIAASNATTFTDYASLFIGSPTAGTNVTISNAFSLITQGAARFGGAVGISAGTLNGTVLDIAQTWGGTGTYTGIKYNVTDSGPSNAASLLADLQVSGSTRFNVDKNGTLTLTGTTGANDSLSATTKISFAFANPYPRMQLHHNSTLWQIDNVSGTLRFFDHATVRMQLGSTGNLSLLTGSLDFNNDTFVRRDGAANTLAQRNSTNAQTFRLYRTADGSPGSNYERLALSSTTYSGGVYNTILCETAGTGADNINLVLGPAGTGAILAQVPDGTATGGDARGTYAVDLQMYRTSSDRVASAPYSFVAGAQCKAVNNGVGNVALGYEATASSNSWSSVALGYQATASGRSSFATSRGSQATGDYSIALGTFALASGEGSLACYGGKASALCAVAIGYFGDASAIYTFTSGADAKADRYGMLARCSGTFGTAGTSTGDAQQVQFVLRIKTTNATPATLMLDGSTTRLTIPSGKVFAFVAKISGIKSDGSAAAFYTRKGCIKNVGGTTSLVGSIETIGTDTEDNASTDVAITADDTNDALQINVTGIAAETWRWVAVVEGVEIGYGT